MVVSSIDGSPAQQLRHADRGEDFYGSGPHLRRGKATEREPFGHVFADYSISLALPWLFAERPVLRTYCTYDGKLHCRWKADRLCQVYTAGEYPFGRVVRRDARLVHMGGRFRFAQPALWVEAPPHTALKQGGLA